MYIVRALVPGSTTPIIGVLTADSFAPLGVPDLATLWSGGLDAVRRRVESAVPAPIPEDLHLLPPIDGRTEVWAAGVTYRRSRDARIEESAQRTVYEQVYDAERPELFFKSVGWRVVTDGDSIGIRGDSADNVPEPELAVIISPGGEILGYVVCNDVSSRSIEGENPLYLPQAKIYARSCALSDRVRPSWLVSSDDLMVSMSIRRSGQVVFEGSTSTADLRRRPPDLIPHLLRAMDFPDGVILSTGTGIVPPLGAGLRAGDEVDIEIGGVGRLQNPVIALTRSISD